MPFETTLFLGILTGMVVLFLTERVGHDLVALLGLLFFILLGYLTPREAFSGYSSTVVLTLIPMFMVGGGLRVTGVAESTAAIIARWFGKGEATTVLVVMLLGCFISSFMNNVAATALLMPTVIGLAQRTSNSPSRLLIPLTFASVLGGATTLIGTSQNIIVSEMLGAETGSSLRFFDYTLLGGAASIVGIIYMVFFGRRLLPARVKPNQPGQINLPALYHLHRNVFTLRVPPDSRLTGRSLAGLHFGESLNVNVVSIIHSREKVHAPGPRDRIYGGDLVLVNGEKEELLNLLRFRGVTTAPMDRSLFAQHFAEKAVKVKESQAGRTVRELNILGKYGVMVLAIARGDSRLIFENLAERPLAEGDTLYILVSNDTDFTMLLEDFDFVELTPAERSEFDRQLAEKLKIVSLPPYSALDDVTLRESNMSALTGLTILAITRGDEILIVSDSEFKLKSGDNLIVLGDDHKISYLSILGDLELLSEEASTKMLESPDAGLIEVVLAPRSQLISKTLSQVSFREKYDMNVVGLWREGRAIIKNLKQIPFKFGDALLLHGLRSKMPVFSQDPDFVLLNDSRTPTDRQHKMFFSLLSIFLILSMSTTGLFTIEVAAWVAAAVLFLSGTLSMQEGYREVDWRVVVLIGALLPISLIIEKLHLVEAFSRVFMDYLGSAGPITMLFIISILTSLVSQALEGSLSVIIFVPLALAIAAQYGIDLKMTAVMIAVSASNAFLAPISHRSHLLVMGAGAYRLRDYLRSGFPLTIAMQAVVFALYYISVTKG